MMPPSGRELSFDEDGFLNLIIQQLLDANPRLAEHVSSIIANCYSSLHKPPRTALPNLPDTNKEKIR